MRRVVHPFGEVANWWALVLSVEFKNAPFAKSPQGCCTQLQNHFHNKLARPRSYFELYLVRAGSPAPGMAFGGIAGRAYTLHDTCWICTGVTGLIAAVALDPRDGFTTPSFRRSPDRINRPVRAGHAAASVILKHTAAVRVSARVGPSQHPEYRI